MHTLLKIGSLVTKSARVCVCVCVRGGHIRVVLEVCDTCHESAVGRIEETPSHSTNGAINRDGARIVGHTDVVRVPAVCVCVCVCVCVVSGERWSLTINERAVAYGWLDSR
jgi:hypothetical protein